MIAANNNKSSAVKNEKKTPATAPTDDGEYDEWARGLVNRPIPQIGNQLTLSSVLNSSPGVDGSLPPHQGFDMDSAIGRFTWYTVANTDKSIPCLYRSGEPFCCIRMFETTVIGDLLNVLPQEVYDAAKVNSHFATPAEAKLLTYISSWHCDGLFGSEPFTIEDLVISVPEMEKFHKYLQFAYDVLSSGGGNKNEDYSKCGYVRVNNESLIPYTVLSETEKGVPLFYFEGQTDILKEKATPLTGWELAYLKICCKIQGVRKDLISKDSLLIIKLTDLKAYFPKRTVFADKCWPAAKSKSLITKQMLTARASINAARSMAAAAAANNSSQQRWAAQSDNSNNFRAANNLTVNRVLGQTPHCGSVNSTANSSAISALTNPLRSVAAYNSYQANGTTQAQLYNNGYQVLQAQQPRNGPMTISSSIGPPRNQIITSKATNLAKLKVNTPPVSMSGLSSIPEYTDGQRDGAYNIRMVIVEQEVVHCINAKPHKPDEYLIILQEFITKFFPGVTIYPTAVSVLKSIGITTFLPNSGQIRVLNNSGFSISRSWEVPLIPAKEANNLMPRIRGLLTPKPPAPRLNQIPDIANSSNRGLSNGFYYPAGQAR